MSEAGLTHGGSYRHFTSKDDLVVESLRAAFDDFAKPLESPPETDSPKVVASGYKAPYLSDAHVANPGPGCPMSALGSDLARESVQIKAEYTAGLQRVIDALARTRDGS